MLAPSQSPPLRSAARPLRQRAPCCARACSSADAPAALSAEAASLSQQLLALGVPLKRQRIVVLGPLSDTRAVGLFEQALEGRLGPALAGEAGEPEVRRLRRALDALAVLREEKAEEAEAYAEAAARRSDPGEAQLTDSERASLQQGITNAAMVGIQGSVWSSMLMLVAGLALVSVLRRE